MAILSEERVMQNPIKRPEHYREKADETLIVDSRKVSKQPKKTRKTKKTQNAGDIAQAVLLTSAKTGHTKPVCIELLSNVPIKALSGTSLYPNNIPDDLGASA